MSSRRIQGAALVLAGAALLAIVTRSDRDGRELATPRMTASGPEQAPSTERAPTPGRAGKSAVARAQGSKPDRSSDLRGRVVWSSDSRPVVGAIVAVEAKSGVRAERRAAETDGAGQFLLQGLKRSLPYKLSVSVEQDENRFYQEQSLLIDGRSEPEEMSIVVRCCDLRGVVVDPQDNPLSGVRVRISAWENGSLVELRRVRTDESGHFIIGHLPIKQNKMRLLIGWGNKDGWGAGQTERTVTLNEQVQMRLLLRREQSFTRLLGVVLDAGGSPLQGARVHRVGFMRSSKDGSLLSVDVSRPLLTDAEGRFALIYVTRGQEYELVVAAAGQAGVSRRVVTPATGELEPLRIQLQPGDSTLRGTVVDANGQPMPGALVDVVDLSYGDDVKAGYECTTNRLGEFELPLLPGRKYAAGAWKEGHEHGGPFPEFKMGRKGHNNVMLKLVKEKQED